MKELQERFTAMNSQGQYMLIDATFNGFLLELADAKDVFEGFYYYLGQMRKQVSLNPNRHQSIKDLLSASIEVYSKLSPPKTEDEVKQTLLNNIDLVINQYPAFLLPDHIKEFTNLSIDDQNNFAAFLARGTSEALSDSLKGQELGETFILQVLKTLVAGAWQSSPNREAFYRILESAYGGADIQRLNMTPEQLSAIQAEPIPEFVDLLKRFKTPPSFDVN